MKSRLFHVVHMAGGCCNAIQCPPVKAEAKFRASLTATQSDCQKPAFYSQTIIL